MLTPAWYGLTLAPFPGDTSNEEFFGDWSKTKQSIGPFAEECAIGHYTYKTHTPTLQPRPVLQDPVARSIEVFSEFKHGLDCLKFDIEFQAGRQFFR